MSFRFRDFDLDEDVFALRREGRDVALRPQAFDVLRHLIEHRDRVVTKEELLATIWRGTAVSDNTLPQAIVAIRRALEDSGEQPTYVQTIRGRGYRFLVEAEAYDEASPVGPAEAPPPRPLVGRDRELAAFDERLRRVAAGRGEMLLVTGEVGAGKTRLLEAFEARALAAGAFVARATCHAIEGAPELWLWSTLVARLAEGAPTGARARAVDGGEDERFVAFDRIVAALRAAAEARTVVLLVDDLHLADPPSMLLLKLVATSIRDRRLLPVVAYRDVALATAGVLARTVGGLVREDPARLLRLASFSQDDVRRLAESWHARPFESSELARIVDKTAGNPALVLQLLGAMSDVTGTGDGGTSALLARREMREAITLHLEGLSSELRMLLEPAAVLGTELSLGLLAAIVGREPEQILASVDEAARARILVATSAGRYRFAHVLVRDVLYRELGAARRAALHERAGAAALADDPESAVDHLERALRILDRLADAPDVGTDDAAARGAALLRHLRGSA